MKVLESFAFFLAFLVSVFFMSHGIVKDENGNWVLTRQKLSVIIGTISTLILLVISLVRSCNKL